MPKAKVAKSSLSVARTAQGWVVRREDGVGPEHAYRTQDEAARAARERLGSSGGVLKIQGRDGRWRETFTIGTKDLGKISAIEGIRVPRKTRQAFREFDRKGLSPDQRRSEIARIFGGKS
jgi:hypothetical protein